MTPGNSIHHRNKWLFIGNAGNQDIRFALGLILPGKSPSKRFLETAQGSVWQKIREHLLGVTKLIELKHSSWMAYGRHTQLGGFVWSSI